MRSKIGTGRGNGGTREITLEAYLLRECAGRPRLAAVVRDIAWATREISKVLRLGGLAGMRGSTGEVNIQGEDVQKMDRFADDIFGCCLELSRCVAALGSEERSEIRSFEHDVDEDCYVVNVDPLDGSSNISAGVTVGSIFSVLDLPQGVSLDDQSVLRPGRDQVAAGYAIYGSSTS